jgi:hypothetical protein
MAAWADRLTYIYMRVGGARRIVAGVFFAVLFALSYLQLVYVNFLTASTNNRANLLTCSFDVVILNLLHV